MACLSSEFPKAEEETIDTEDILTRALLWAELYYYLSYTTEKVTQLVGVEVGPPTPTTPKIGPSPNSWHPEWECHSF